MQLVILTRPSNRRLDKEIRILPSELFTSKAVINSAVVAK